jgi:hypothetical protein
LLHTWDNCIRLNSVTGALLAEMNNESWNISLFPPSVYAWFF